jgi:hypothetical protein
MLASSDASPTASRRSSAIRSRSRLIVAGVLHDVIDGRLIVGLVGDGPERVTQGVSHRMPRDHHVITPRMCMATSENRCPKSHGCMA